MNVYDRSCTGAGGNPLPAAKALAAKSPGQAQVSAQIAGGWRRYHSVT
jgi:hypothetical protein